jgi:hypothetical protein
MSEARLQAEMAWAVLTGRAPAFLATFEDVPRQRPAPAVPRGKGRRQPKPPHPVLVEIKRTKLLSRADGARLAVRRTERSVIQA